MSLICPSIEISKRKSNFISLCLRLSSNVNMKMFVGTERSTSIPDLAQRIPRLTKSLPKGKRSNLRLKICNLNRLAHFSNNLSGSRNLTKNWWRLPQLRMSMLMDRCHLRRHKTNLWIKSRHWGLLDQIGTSEASWPNWWFLRRKCTPLRITFIRRTPKAEEP